MKMPPFLFYGTNHRTSRGGRREVNKSLRRLSVVQCAQGKALESIERCSISQMDFVHDRSISAEVLSCSVHYDLTAPLLFCLSEKSKKR